MILATAGGQQRTEEDSETALVEEEITLWTVYKESRENSRVPGETQTVAPVSPHLDGNQHLLHCDVPSDTLFSYSDYATPHVSSHSIHVHVSLALFGVFCIKSTYYTYYKYIE